MTQKPNGNGKPSKADFVRSMPKTMKIADIIAAGKKAGIAITASNVHATRYQDQKSGGKKKAVKKTLSKKGKASSTLLSKYPGMRKTHEAFDETELTSQAMTGLVVGLRQMVKASVREELRAVLGGVFDQSS